MLVLTRKSEEAIRLLDGSIRIVVLEVQGDQVRLGFEAPKNIDILREEIFLAQAENERAATSVTPETLTRITQGAPPAASPHWKPKSPES